MLDVAMASMQTVVWLTNDSIIVGLQFALNVDFESIYYYNSQCYEL